MTNSGPIPKTKAPKIFLSDDQIEADELAARRVELSDETLEAYQRAMNPGYPFWHRVRMFFRAENEAGRIAKIVKDAALVFLPYGDKIETAADFITTRIEPVRDNDMNWIKNRLTEKSTWRGIVVAHTGLGMGLSPEQREAIVAAGVAVFTLIEVFGKEPQSPDARG